MPGWHIYYHRDLVDVSVKKVKMKLMGVSPNGDTKSDVGQQVWVLVDAVDCRDGNLSSLDSILLPVRSTTISIFKNY